MTAMAIAPFPPPPMAVQQDSAVLELGSIIVQFAQADAAGHQNSGLASLTQALEVPAEAMDALQRLVQLLQELQSTQPHSSDESSFTPETLVPYAMEEALDLLDALQENTNPDPKAILEPLLIQLERLATPILWAIARSTYPIMELLEGSHASARLPGQGWSSGVLRLVPLLEISTPDQYWRFDLTTGREPQTLIDPALQIQLEKVPVLDLHADSKTPLGSVLHSANQHLQRLQQYLSAYHPALQALFRGLSVDLLPPKSLWLQGELKLTLDFEFAIQGVDFEPAFQPLQASCVDAELLEEPDPQNGIASPVAYSTSVSLAVLEMPAPLLEPTTLIRMADPALLDNLTQSAYRQVMGAAIAQLQPLVQSPDSADPVLRLIRTACNLTNLAQESTVEQLIQQNYSLVQPELLIDELAPKLLWQLSRCSYAIMQWIGGISTALLQPDYAWETGILRLMPVLALNRFDRTWQIDLVTGRLISDPSWQFNPEAIALVSSSASEIAGIAAPSSPVLLGSLLDRLVIPLQTAAPEVAWWQQAIAVEWLTSEQEWQAGQMTLQWEFDWMPDVR